MARTVAPRAVAAGVRDYRRRAYRPFPFARWAAGASAVLGAGLVLGIPSPAVPDRVEPAVGLVLLALAVRAFWRSRRRARP